MPVFILKCTACSSEQRRLLSKREALPCACGQGMMEPKLPTTVQSMTMETRDPHRGEKLRKGHEGKLKERLVRQHDAYEVAQKIDEHGMNDALKFGWVKKNYTPK